MKVCSKCKENKDLSEFAKDKYNPDGLTFRCKKCRNKHYNDYYKSNPEKQKLKNDSQKENRKKYYSSAEGIKSSRRAHLKRAFGISLEEYEEKLEKQEYKCAICKSFNTHDKHGVLAVDHCHKTGKIRDLLCFKCNTVLGSVNDNIQILENMINYLKYYNNVQI
jgi:hypothetical protein